jgi:AcrR family transcriptional regulator
MTAGLRDRKKQATRLAISDIATTLFEQHGFDAVSIAQVAAAAGVAKMTVTNYFPRKEDLVFDRHEQLMGALARVVADRNPGESPLDAVRRDYLDAVARRDVTLGFSRVSFARMIEDSPVLLAALSDYMHQRELALAAVLRDEEGLDDVMAQFKAAQLGSVHRILFADARHRTLAGESREQIQVALADAATRMFDSLEPRVP